MTAVVDASAFVPVLLERDGAAGVIGAQLVQHELIAPHIIDLEVARSLRRHGRHAAASEVALLRFRLLGVRRFDHESLLARIWELRHNMTAYDAAYVALAEGEQGSTAHPRS